MVEVYLALGSNEGDRAANIAKAVSLVSELRGTEVVAQSDVVESRADGFEGADFLNCCIKVRTSLGAEEMLDRVKEIEKALGRTNEGIRTDENGNRLYSDRPIDIDILLYGNERINTDRLTVPHPRMWERPYVTGPLKQIFK